MIVEKNKPGTTAIVLMICATGSVRVIFNFNHDISSLANFSPIGAMALFGGSYFNRQWKAFSFPLLTLFLSDFILHQTVFKTYSEGILYGGWYWVYGAFALMTIAGRWILKTFSVARFVISVFVCLLIHWIITDIGVWYGSATFGQDIYGFADCLVRAIPYELRFLTGTLVYGIILFGVCEWMKSRSDVPAVR